MKYLIAGLGNIGLEYELTRHNIGFMVLDHFAKKHNLTFVSDRLASICELKYKGKSITLIKPTTFMNLSGKAVNYWMQNQKIPIENILVITDDLNLPLATMRLRAKGSSGGQNGLNSINETLQTENYARLRMGIGNNFPKGQQVNYVLSRFSKEEYETYLPILDKASDAILSFCTDGVERAMNVYNTK
ncbi:MAG: aminoacyl-tRNA hydrolase [Bacteroidota bacterium]|nr:aminoacyl-tRNA hydrolase [Bacteroidota bacterium]